MKLIMDDSTKMFQEMLQKIEQTKADFKLNLIDKYDEYRVALEKTQVKLKDKILELNTANPSWFEKKDIRIYVVIKLLSLVSSTKLGILENKLFVLKENWPDLFFEDVVPKNILIDIGQVGYIKELDTTLRFAYFQRMFSNYEAFVKMLALACPAGTTNDYKGFVTQYLKLKKDDDNFLNILKWVRNSIHNNGIHIPDDSKHDNKTFTYKAKQIEFRKFHWVDVSWQDVINLVDDLIDLSFQIIDDKKIQGVEYIEDIVERKRKVFNKPTELN